MARDRQTNAERGGATTLSPVMGAGIRGKTAQHNTQAMDFPELKEAFSWRGRTHGGREPVNFRPNRGTDAYGPRRTTPKAQASDERRLPGPQGRRCEASTILDRKHGDCHRGSAPCATGVSCQWKYAATHAPQAEGSLHEKTIGLGHLQTTAQETTRTEARTPKRGSQDPNKLSRHMSLTFMNRSSTTGLSHV